METSRFSFERLVPVRPVVDGLARLKDDIEAQATVFCICAVARQYHVSAHDAKDTFKRAVERNKLVVSRSRDQSLREAIHNSWSPLGDEDYEDAIFVPTSSRDHDAIEVMMRTAHDSVDEAYRLLSLAYPEYHRGKRLADQGGELHGTFVESFRRLQRVGALPSTTGNSAFNHQGMTLLMRDCFKDERALVQHMRDPQALRLVTDYECLIEELYAAIDKTSDEVERRRLTHELREHQAAVSDLLEAQYQFQARSLGQPFADFREQA
jgi:hypothetical protein